MNDPLVTSSGPVVRPDVQEFAVTKGVNHYLNAVIDLARQAFPSSALCLSVGEDAEDERHQYIALEVDFAGRATEEYVAGQRLWSATIGRVCPSRQAVYFVPGWR
jgi:hypothetical protein